MTQPRRSPIPLLLALALVTVPLLPSVAAGSHEATSPRQAWTSMGDALDAGDVSTARGAYQDAFAPVAEHAPRAEAAIQTAFDTAETASTGSPAYSVAQQTIEKGAVAIAYHAFQQAAADGNVETAQAHAEVLFEKFPEDDALEEAKQALPNATSQTLADAAATLEDEYLDLIAATVYAETSETPDLLAGGDTATAASEAGEAVGYGLSLHASVEATLGTGTADRLETELTGLAEHVLAGAEDEVREEADEILGILAAYGLATAPRETVDAFHAYKDEMGNGNWSTAQAIYNETFAEEAEEYAATAHERIGDAFPAAREAANAEATGDLVVQRQILAKTILDVAWQVGFHELREGEIHEGLAYIAVLADKFTWFEDEPEPALSLGHIAASNQAADAHVDAVEDGLADEIVSKIRAELEETFFNWNDTVTAREKAIEALVYARPAFGWFEAELGKAPTEELFDELEVFYNATTERDRDAAEAASEEITTLLDQLTAGEGASELETLLVNLEDKIDFIAEEYRGYQTAKEAGDEREARVEMGEARAFTNSSRDLVEEIRELLADADEAALDALRGHLDAIEELLVDRGDVEALETEVTAAIDALDRFRQATLTGPAVDVAVGPADLEDGTATVPIRLANLPEAGYSVQANVTYDASVITVEDVEIPAAVGASDTATEGVIRFNAADTSGGTAIVAEVTTRVEGAVTEASFDVSIETLTDSEGEPLRMGNVTGTQLDLASADQGSDGTDDDGGTDGVGDAEQPAPGVGALVAILAASLVALGLARRR